MQNSEKNAFIQQFYAKLFKLDLKADCGDREDKWVKHMIMAHFLFEKTFR